MHQPVTNAKSTQYGNLQRSDFTHLILCTVSRVAADLQHRLIARVPHELKDPRPARIGRVPFSYSASFLCTT
jgi:hypothetical protein